MEDLSWRILVPNAILDNWVNRNQSTPLNPKSKCHLSPALLSRISFNDRSLNLLEFLGK